MKKVILGLLLGLATVALRADEAAPGRFSGLLYGDYYSVAAHHNGRLAGLDGFWLRRLFLTYDQDLKQDLAWRLRFEASADDFNKPSGNLSPWVKDAWVKWSYSPEHRLYAGLLESPAFGWLDKQWGLRSVEKSPLDLQGWAPTREQGLGLEGSVAGTGYFLTLGNGGGEASEGADNGKRAALRLDHSIGQGGSAMLYGDLAGSTAGGLSPDPYSYVLQAFLGWKAEIVRGGLTYGRQVLVLPGTGDEKVKDLVSGYAVGKVAEGWQAFARVDHLLWGTVNKAGLKYLDLAAQRGTLGIVGVDWKAAPNLNVQPNVEFSYYQNDAGGPVASQVVLPRLTIYLQF